MRGCEDIHRVNLPLHAVEIRQLPPYQLLEYLEKIGRYLDEILRGFPRRGAGSGGMGGGQDRDEFLLPPEGN